MDAGSGDAGALYLKQKKDAETAGAVLAWALISVGVIAAFTILVMYMISESRMVPAWDGTQAALAGNP